MFFRSLCRGALFSRTPHTELYCGFVRRGNHQLFVDVELEKSKLVLSNHGFSSEQINTVLTQLEPYLKRDSSMLMQSSLDCWRYHLTPRTKKNVNYQHEFIDVFVTTEPKLLLLGSDFIVHRMSMLKSLDFINGTRDYWTLFVKSPAGYYLQDWNEFLKKYYFFTFKVLPWFNSLCQDVSKNPKNPLMQCPPVMELAYLTIKTRFLFVQRTGYKETHVGEVKNVNLKTLFMLPVSEFIRIYSPYCTVEEYNGLEKLNASLSGQEDDRLLEDIVKLAPKGANTKAFIEKNLNETYLLSDIAK